MKTLLGFCVILPLVLVAMQPKPVEDYVISGVVVDHLTNRPLSKVLVDIERINADGGDAQVVTSEDGRFTFLHLPFGKYRLSAEKRRQPNQSFFRADGQYSTAIVIDGKTPTTGLIFPLISDSSLHVNVNGDGGVPLFRASVGLYRDAVIEGESQAFESASSATDQAGHVDFNHLQPGEYFLFVSAQGDSPADDRSYPVTFYGGGDSSSAKKIRVVEGTSVDMQMNLQSQPSIHVRLTSPPNWGGFGLYAEGPYGLRVQVNVSFSFLDSSGAPSPDESEKQAPHFAQLNNLVAGRYQLEYYPPNRAPSSRIVDLSDGATIDLSTEPAGSSISGVITFEGKKPDKNLLVHLTQPSAQLQAKVLSDGTFRFNNVGPGSYRLFQSSPELLISAWSAQNAVIVDDKLKVPPNASIRLHIHIIERATAVKLDGFATNNGNAFPGAMVLLIPQDPSRQRLLRRDQSDSDGSFTLQSVVPGKYTLLAIDDGRDLAYRNSDAIAPYLAAGVPITVPTAANSVITVPVQPRRR